MSGTSRALRRAAVLAVVLGAIAAAASWARRRAGPVGRVAAPEWPPIHRDVTQTEAPSTDAMTADAVSPDPVSPDPVSPDPVSPDPVSRDAAPADHAPTGWVAAGEGLEPPPGFPVKAKVSSGIFHVPGGRFYDRTNADRFYATTDAAEADGYRRSKS